ncbi:MAG: hypothetical protein AABY22_31345, partial [Nanoarchaeota archaeon]
MAKEPKQKLTKEERSQRGKEAYAKWLESEKAKKAGDVSSTDNTTNNNSSSSNMNNSKSQGGIDVNEMTENKNICEVCGSGDGRCGQCGNMCGWRGNSILRWILGIIIVTWIFALGMKMGEMKAFLEQAGYGRSAQNMMYRTMPLGGAGG